MSFFPRKSCRGETPLQVLRLIRGRTVSFLSFLQLLDVLLLLVLRRIFRLAFPWRVRVGHVDGLAAGMHFRDLELHVVPVDDGPARTFHPLVQAANQIQSVVFR